MPIYRYYLNSPLTPNSEVILDDEEAHHLIHVTKVKVGTAVELVNGHNTIAKATVVRIERAQAHLKITASESRAAPSSKLILAQAIVRANRLDTIVEKGTELGMDALWIFPASRSEEKTIYEAQRKRLERISINAMKQSGRLDLPKIALKPPLEAWNEALPLPAFFGDTKSHKRLETSSKEALIFIGPESGFSEEEREWFCRHQVMGVKLHENILRVDTAAIIAVGVLSSLTSINRNCCS